MHRSLFASSLCLVTVLASAQTTAKRQIIPLYESETRMIVMLRLDGSAPMPVVFDTGSSGNLIDLSLADRLNLPNNGPSPSIDGSTGKPVPGHDSFFKNATLSGIPIPDARATAFIYNMTDEAGIVGPNSFPHQLVRVEGVRSRIVLLPLSKDTVPPCPSFPYLGKGDDALPSATVEIGPLKIPAILDSGNDSSFILPMDYIAQLTLEAPPTAIGYAVSAAGRQPILSAHLKGSMKIGDAVLDRPEIRFMAGGRPNVGLPILKKLTLVIDPSSQRDWVLSADSTQGTCTAPKATTSYPQSR